MLQSLEKTLKLIFISDYKKFFILIGILIISAALDVIGIASLVPFVELVTSQNTDISENFLYKIANFIFPEISISNYLVQIGIMLIFINLFATLIRLLSIRAQIKFVHNLGAHLSNKLVKSYLAKNYNWFKKQTTSELTKSILNEANILVGSAILPIINIASNLIITLLIISFLAVFNLHITLIVFSLLSLTYLIIFKYFRTKISKAGANRIRSTGQQFRILDNLLKSIKIIKITQTEDFFFQKYKDATNQNAANKITSLTIAGLPRHLIEGISFTLIIIAILAIYSYFGFSNVISIISVLVVSLYKLIPSIQNIYHSLVQFKFSENVINDLYEPLIVDVASLKTKAEKIKLTKKIQLKNITFYYDNSESPIFQNFSCSIEAFKLNAIVGPSGAGKTTLIDLICGFETPQFGDVLLDGVALKKLIMPSWQSSIGYVSQEVQIIDGSIKDNIILGNNENLENNDRLLKMLKICLIDNFLAENNYDLNTDIGKIGANLSGGQKQRIGIARALYNDVSLLVLDEATNGMDTKLQAELLSNLKVLSGNLTIIMITHRDDAIKLADTIISV